MAAAIKSFKTVELFLDLGLSINEKDWMWRTSLIQIMREMESLKNDELINHLIPTVTLLLKSGANSKTGIWGRIDGLYWSIYDMLFGGLDL